jgi:UDP:flavonoid glycosyltransferase YjiC (YdhE family)
MKPSILIPVPNHPEQYGNVRRTQELGVAVGMHQKDLDKDNLSRVIQQVTKGNLKLRLEKMSQEISLSNGLTHTIDAIRKLLY